MASSSGGAGRLCLSAATGSHRARRSACRLSFRRQFRARWSTTWYSQAFGFFDGSSLPRARMKASWTTSPASSIERPCWRTARRTRGRKNWRRSEEHTSELQSRRDLVCRLLLEKKKEREQITKKKDKKQKKNT